MATITNYDKLHSHPNLVAESESAGRYLAQRSMVGSLGSALGCPQHGWGRGWEGTRDGTQQGQDSPVSGTGGGKMCRSKETEPLKEGRIPSPDSLNSCSHKLPRKTRGSDTQEESKCPWSYNSNGCVPVRW